MIEIRLQKREEAFAKEGASFWIVRRKFLEPVCKDWELFSADPRSNSTPGAGATKECLPLFPSSPSFFGEGLEIMVHATRIEHLEENSPVYYRGEQVGVVRDVRLGPNADRVEARLTVWRRYSALVRRKFEVLGSQWFRYERRDF